MQPPEGCTPRTPFCGRRRLETQCAWRTPKLQQSFTQQAESVSRKGGHTALIMEET